MFGGVALCDCFDLLAGCCTKDRIRTREGRPEIYFLLTDRERVLPVFLGGQAQPNQWGVRRGQSQRLPQAMWIHRGNMEACRLNWLAPQEVVIGGNRAVDNGIWYDIREGVRAIRVQGEQGVQIVYPLVEPASTYYRGMTGSEWMPCLVRQWI